MTRGKAVKTDNEKTYEKLQLIEGKLHIIEQLLTVTTIGVIALTMIAVVRGVLG